jgi:hypothetical protein
MFKCKIETSKHISSRIIFMSVIKVESNLLTINTAHTMDHFIINK